MKITKKALLLGMALTLAFTGAGLAQSKMMEWDGSHWKALTQELKVAYILGMGNMASFETTMSGPQRAGCISRTFVEELKTKTVGQVVAEVDKYFKDHPDKLHTRVIEVVLERCTKLCLVPPPAPEKKK
jgi:hypothetical protein